MAGLCVFALNERERLDNGAGYPGPHCGDLNSEVMGNGDNFCLTSSLFSSSPDCQEGIMPDSPLRVKQGEPG